jgi:hypothetical protein
MFAGFEQEIETTTSTVAWGTTIPPTPHAGIDRAGRGDPRRSAGGPVESAYDLARPSVTVTGDRAAISHGHGRIIRRQREVMVEPSYRGIGVGWLAKLTVAG